MSEKTFPYWWPRPRTGKTMACASWLNQFIYGSGRITHMPARHGMSLTAPLLALKSAAGTSTLYRLIEDDLASMGEVVSRTQEPAVPERPPCLEGSWYYTRRRPQPEPTPELRTSDMIAPALSLLGLPDDV